MAKGLKNIIQNCKEATRLSLKREEAALTLREHIQVRVHLSFCDACTQFVKQSAIINKALKQFREHIKQPSEGELSSSARERIQARLNELK